MRGSSAARPGSTVRSRPPSRADARRCGDARRAAFRCHVSLVAAGRRAADQEGRWSAEPLARGWLNAGALDLRLSTGQLTVGAATIENAALSLQLGGGRMDLVLSDGKLRGGTVKGRMSFVDLPDSRMEMRLQGSCDRIDIAQVASLAASSGCAASPPTARPASRRGSLGGCIGRQRRGTHGGRGARRRTARFDLDRLSSRPRRPPARTGGPVQQPVAADAGRRRQGEDHRGVPSRALRRGRAIDGSIGLASRTFDVTLRPTATVTMPKPGEARVRLEGPWSGPSLGN